MTAETPPSPQWSPTIKLIVGLTIAALLIVLLVNFRNFIGPLLLSFVLTYLFHPIAAWVNRITKLNWRMSVNLVYLVILILIISSFTISGIAVVQQIQNLIQVVQNFINTLPDLAADLSTREFTFGPLPFVFNLSQLNLQSLSERLLSTLQPLLGQVGNLVSSFATGAATIIGWGLFTLVISYFLLAESGNVNNELIRFEIPGYDADIRRLGRELRNIWNSFLRGQLVIILLVILSYTLLMTILGVKYSYAIAILAGVARFLPYIGPLITWIVLILVTLFQGSNYFGLQPLHHAILALTLAFLLDQVFDNLVQPKIMGQSLRVHPAAVLIAALIAAKLIGLSGLVLAAPVLASMKLIGRYIFRKMLDLDPWMGMDQPAPVIEFPWVRWRRRLQTWWRLARRR